MYLLETHMHTMESSRCCHVPAAEMIRGYAARGYNGVIVTDHFLSNSCTVPESLPWTEKIETFADGFRAARAEGERLGIDVFFGFEKSDGDNDFLTYGISPELLKRFPDINKLGINEFSRIIHDNGGFITHAHPYRMESYIHHVPQAKGKDVVDAIEVNNGDHRGHDWDAKALTFAQENDMLCTAGSDAHRPGTIANGVFLPRRPVDINDICRMLRDGKHKLLCGYYEQN